MLLITSIYIIIYLICRSIWRYKKYGKITKVNKDKNKDFEQFNEELHESQIRSLNAELLRKRFIKMNEKNKKRGKAPITYKEFSEKIMKENRNAHYRDKILIIVIIFMMIIGSIQPISEDLIGGLLFLGLLEVFAILIFKIVLKSTKEATESTQKILNECEEQGIDIIEYAERLKKK